MASKQSRRPVLPLPVIITKEEFLAKPLKDRKILLAQDIILHAKAGRLLGNPGSYVRFFNKHTAAGLPYNAASATVADAPSKTLVTEPSMRKALKIATCNVCMRGAIFYSAIMRTNNCSIGALRSSANETDRVCEDLGAFTYEELSEIEDAFEGWGDDGRNEIAKRNYYRAFDDPTHRLVAIALNIIEHGRFLKTKKVSREAVAAALGIPVADVQREKR